MLSVMCRKHLTTASTTPLLLVRSTCKGVITQTVAIAYNKLFIVSTVSVICYRDTYCCAVLEACAQQTVYTEHNTNGNCKLRAQHSTQQNLLRRRVLSSSHTKLFMSNVVLPPTDVT
jgi:hypothetical protein